MIIKFEYKKLKLMDYIYEVPNYLISKKIPENYYKFNKKITLFYKKYILNKFFIPNNLSFS